MVKWHSQSLSFNIMTYPTFSPLPWRRRAKSEPNQTCHGDSGVPYLRTKTFSHMMYSFTARGRWKLEENARPIKNRMTPKLHQQIISNLTLTTWNLLLTLKIMSMSLDTPMRGVYIPKLHKIFSFWVPETMGVKFGTEEVDFSTPNFTPSVQRVASKSPPE